MLVLTRRPGQRIVIDGDVVIQVVSVQGDKVRIGIVALAEMRILREELVEVPPSGEQDDWRADRTTLSM